MTLFGNFDFEASEIFVLAYEKPKEFKKLIEADNMISLCEAIENVYNTEMFLMGQTKTCYISYTKNMRESLVMDVFLVNVGLKDEISLNTNLFKQAVETIKKIEELMDTRKDGSQRLPNEVGVAWRLGACVDFNHLANTNIRFDSEKISSATRSRIFLENRTRKRTIKKRKLTEKTVKRENFKLPTIKADSIVQIPSFKIFFEGENKRENGFMQSTLDCFFLKMKSEMEKESNRVFPKENGVFQRIKVGEIYYLRNHSTTHILSLRFDGRRDVGPRGVLTKSYKVDPNDEGLYITDKEEEEKNDLRTLLKEEPFVVRECEVLEKGEDDPSPILFQEGRKFIKGPFTDLLTEAYRKVFWPHGVRDRFQAFLYPQTVVLKEEFLIKITSQEELRREFDGVRALEEEVDIQEQAQSIVKEATKYAFG